MKKSFFAGIVPMVGLFLLASCSEITGSITLDADGGELIWYPEGQDEPEVLATDDPIFSVGSGSTTYTATANSELPRKIATVQARKSGYHFSGWGQVVNGVATAPYLQDFSSARMPYAAATYRAVFAELTSVTFVAVDSQGEELSFGGTPVEKLVLSGEDCYVGATIDNTEIASVLDSLLEKIPENYRSEGEFTGVYKDPTEDSASLGVINVDQASPIYYVRWSEYPVLTIHYNNGTPDSTAVIKPGSSLTPYLPTEDPVKESAVFDAWYVNEECTDPFYGDSFLVMPSSNLDIYAHYFDEIPLTLSVPEGWTLPEGVPTTVLTGKAVGTLPVPDAPDGYDFDFWYLDGNGDGIYTEPTADNPTGDLRFTDTTVIPDDTASLTLCAAFSEWNRAYLDLRGLEDEITSYPSGFEPVEGMEGVYSMPVDGSATLLPFYDLSSYSWDDTAIALLGFEAYVGDIDPSDESSVDAAEQGEAYTDLERMPANDVVIKPVSAARVTVTLNSASGESPVQIYPVSGTSIDSPDDPIFGSWPDIPAPEGADYVSERLTGWLDQSQTPISYPYVFSEAVTLTPIYSKVTSLTFQDGNGQNVLELSGISGKILSDADRSKIADAFATLTGEGQKLLGFEDAIGNYVSFDNAMRYPSSNAILTPQFAPVSNN